MAGLLDMMNSDQGLLGLHLMAAAAPRERRMGFGEGLLTSLQGVQAQRAAEEERKARRQMQEMQMQQQQMQLAQMQAAQQREQGIEQAYRGAMRTPEQAAMQKFGGPTVAAAQAAPGMAPQIDQAALLRGLMQADPRQAFQMMQPKPTEYKNVGNSLVAIGPEGVKPVYRDPDKPSEAPADYRLWELSGAKDRGIPFDQWDLARRRAGAANTQVSYGAPMAGVDAQGRPVFFQPDRQGGAPAIVPGVTPPKIDKPLTESQAKAAAFGSQMRAASKELGESGYDPNSIGAQVEVNVAGGLGNLVAGPAAQRARQSQEQWAEALLRFKTGAASTEDEVRRNVRTYFPQPGDSAAVIAQKQRMRQQAEQDVSIAAGGGAQNVVDFRSLK